MIDCYIRRGELRSPAKNAKIQAFRANAVRPYYVVTIKTCLLLVFGKALPPGELSAHAD